MAIIHPGTDVGMSCNDTSVHGRNVLQWMQVVKIFIDTLFPALKVFIKSLFQHLKDSIESLFKIKILIDSLF